MGEWIPEPLPDRREWISGRSGGTTADPADRVTLDESINMAFLVVLESMTPAERVAFILHDVFRYSFAEVAEIVGRTPAACRQLASAARRRIARRRRPHLRQPSRPTSSGTSNRHGKPRTSTRSSASSTPTPRRSATAAAWSAPSSPHRRRRADRPPWSISPAGHPDLTILERTVNGQPGLVAQQDGVTVTVFAFDIAGDRIKHIWAVRNPEKLRPWTTG